MVLVGTATVASQGAHLVDQVIGVGAFAGHRWGLSHGHGHTVFDQLPDPFSPSSLR